MRPHFLPVLVFFFLACLALPAGAQDLSLFEKRQFQSADGAVLPYRILYPKKYNRSKKYPLVLFLHAAGERGTDNEAQLAYGASLFLDSLNRSKFPAIVVFPQCAPDEYWTELTPDGKSWKFPFNASPPPSLRRTIALLGRLQQGEAVDPQRIYLMGISMGGFAVFDLMARFPELFAAGVTVAGGGSPLLAPLYAGHTSLWAFHGAKDDVVPPALSRQVCESLMRQGADVKYTEYPDVKHESWKPALAEAALLPWLFSRKLNDERRYQRTCFGQANKNTYTYATKNGEALALDVYRPAGDTVRSRPTVLYVHGGGFSGGRRDEPQHAAFAEQLARMGYVVVCMSYRLTMKGQSFGCDQPAANKIRTFQASVEDIRDATNYLLNNRGKLGINQNQLVLAGSSAGAEAVLHAAYWRDSNLLPTSPKLPADFRYAGVISMAGAIVDTSLISRRRAIPTMLFHGTCDPLVPFAAAPHHYCQETDPGYLPLFGGYTIAQRLRSIGMPYFLLTACYGQHEWNSIPLSDFVGEITNFLYEDVYLGRFRQIMVRHTQTGNCTDGSLPLECEPRP
ncbi:MAG: prolyl oligopeptidase family serine peptidase [Phaeodactylibacter sp.]|nr:prolyl oligopeptidase family serine peptidase [Phaeodactylibacter sp.]MCB9276482.1 prolyl oligopeptidase family serine peptidase [Lewinellaceae bacterium]